MSQRGKKLLPIYCIYGLDDKNYIRQSYWSVVLLLNYGHFSSRCNKNEILFNVYICPYIPLNCTYAVNGLGTRYTGE